MKADLIAHYTCILMLACVALSRLPLLDAGYGVNVDAWRVARAARHIAQTGEYEASRFPGYPVHEIVCSWFWKRGPVPLNALSAAFSLAAVFATWLIARRLHCRDSCLLALSLAAAPVFFVNSVTAKDYVWAVAFLLWAFYTAIDRRPVLCGLLLGLAVGCRITSAVMFVPIAMVLYGNEAARWKSVLSRFTASTAGTAGLLFLPVWARYGWGFFTFYENHARPDVVTVMNRATIEVWGTLGATGLLLALVATVVFFRRSLRTALPEPANRLLMPAFVTMIVLCLIAYLRLPDQAGYLIPMMPALLFFTAQLAPRCAFQLACAFLLVAPWLDFGGGAPRAARLSSITGNVSERCAT